MPQNLIITPTAKNSDNYHVLVTRKETCRYVGNPVYRRLISKAYLYKSSKIRHTQKGHQLSFLLTSPPSPRYSSANTFFLFVDSSSHTFPLLEVLTTRLRYPTYYCYWIPYHDIIISKTKVSRKISLKFRDVSVRYRENSVSFRKCSVNFPRTFRGSS